MDGMLLEVGNGLGKNEMLRRHRAECHVNAMYLFDRARRRARWCELWARLCGRPRPRLCPMDDVSLGLENGRYKGLQTVSLDRIVGSEGRHNDFDAHFCPLNSDNQRRWIRIAIAWLQGITLPPVDLIQVGDAYFVRDGNHRVSVARALGIKYIDAEVIAWD